MPFSIHVLGIHDALLMRSVLSVFGEAFHDVQTYNCSQPSTAYLENLLGSDILRVSNTKPPHPRRYIKADILTQVSEN